MKRTLFQGLVLSLFILAAVPAAADITHNFNTKYTIPRTIEEVDATHWHSTDDGIIYTLGGTAELFWDINHKPYGGKGAYICFNLLKNGDYLTISPLGHLSGMVINHISDYAGNILSRTKVGVYLSTNNSDWTEIASDNISYTAGTITVTVPVGGPYYVKIGSKSSTKISITQITYSFSDCNCFTYTPE